LQQDPVNRFLQVRGPGHDSPSGRKGCLRSAGSLPRILVRQACWPAWVTELPENNLRRCLRRSYQIVRSSAPATRAPSISEPVPLSSSSGRKGCLLSAGSLPRILVRQACWPASITALPENNLRRCLRRAYQMVRSSAPATRAPSKRTCPAFLLRKCHELTLACARMRPDPIFPKPP